MYLDGVIEGNELLVVKPQVSEDDPSVPRSMMSYFWLGHTVVEATKPRMAPVLEAQADGSVYLDIPRLGKFVDDLMKGKSTDGTQ